MRVPILPLALVLAPLAAGAAASAASSPGPPPRLVVFLVVDQLRHDALGRFAGVLEGGLARLQRESVSWSEARHRHARTATAPGHATLATGADPARHGVIGNEWYDRAEEDEVYCIEDEASPIVEPDGSLGDEDDGRSPRSLRIDGLGDWLQAEAPAARVWALGGKDRGAVLLGGRHPDGAFWFDRDTGRFVTSTWYARREPAWVAAFHRSDPVEALLGTIWEPLPVDRAALAAAGVVQAEDGRFARRFPYALGRLRPAADEEFYEAVYDSPFVDARVARFARALVEAESLGADAVPDLLFLSLSAYDEIGHEFGPDSFESADVLVRLDRELGDLFAWLDARLGSAGWAAVLSADHGVLPLPELLAERGVAARRAVATDVGCLQAAHREVAAPLGLATVVPWGWYLDRPAIAAAGGDPAAVARALAEGVAKCPAVDGVWTAEALARGEAPPEFQRGFDIARSADLVVRYDPYFAERLDRGTDHGSPWEYDRRVPWLLRWPGLAPRTIHEPVETVDVAPTVAALLGIAPAGEIDGRDRSGSLRTVPQADDDQRTPPGQSDQSAEAGGPLKASSFARSWAGIGIFAPLR